jgi:hypothetical protein
MKKILGEARSVRQLLSGSKYSIDYYQREYRWERKQAIELVEDLTSRFLEDHVPAHERKAVEGYGHYFLGSVIVSQKDAVKYIVDGQQRLTTLTLLLILLNNLQRERTDQVPIRDLIFSERYGKKSFNIDVEERVEAMEALFEGRDFDTDGKSEAVANIVARFEDIEEAFPEELTETSLPYFIDWIVDNVHLVEITAFSDDDAYTIFETMNDRGLSLSPTDMLKGYVLSNINDAKKRVAANELWKERIQALASDGKEADADFFKSWLRSQNAQSIRVGGKGAEPGDFDRIGSEFHRWVRDTREDLGLQGSDGFLRFIRQDFDFYSRHYLRLMRASRQLTPGLEHVYFNAQSGFTLQPMLLLAPIWPVDSEAVVDLKWRIAARYLDVFLMRRQWNYRSVDQSTMKYSLFQTTLAARRLDPATLGERLTEELDTQPESFSTNVHFALHGMNRKTIARILARLTDFVERGSGIASRYLEYTATGGGKKSYEVEHVWADKAERHTEEFAHEADFRAYRNRIGGLLLLPKSFNASYGDLPYEQKLPHYNAQNLLARSLNPQCYLHNPGFIQFIERTGLPFRPYEQFGKADLDERTELYRQIAEQVWNPDALQLEIEA